MTSGPRVPDPVHTWLLESSAELGDPMAGFDRLIGQVAATPQRRPWWSVRSASLGRRGLLVVGALLAAGALAGAGLLAIEKLMQRTIVVAQDGSGDARTIGEGVALARSGDTVLIRPGTYAEDVTVTTDITITGSGSRAAVMWRAVAPAEMANNASTRAVAFEGGSRATLRMLTIVGQEMGEAITVGDGAAPTIEDVDVDMPDRTGGDPIAWHEGGGGTIRRSRLSGVIEISNRRATPIIEDNDMTGACVVNLHGGGSAATASHLVIRRNRISACSKGAALQIHTGTAIIEDNNVQAEGGTGILLGGAGKVELRRNTIHGSAKGIQVGNARGALLLARNDVIDNVVGIGIFGPGEGVRLEDNTIRGNEVGLTLAGPGDPELLGNTLCDNGVDIKLVPADRPMPSFGAPAGCAGSEASASPG